MSALLSSCGSNTSARHSLGSPECVGKLMSGGVSNGSPPDKPFFGTTALPLRSAVAHLKGPGFAPGGVSPFALNHKESYSRRRDSNPRRVLPWTALPTELRRHIAPLPAGTLRFFRFPLWQGLSLFRGTGAMAAPARTRKEVEDERKQVRRQAAPSLL